MCSFWATPNCGLFWTGNAFKNVCQDEMFKNVFKRSFLALENESRGETGIDSRVFGGVDHDARPFRAQFGSQGGQGGVPENEK